MYLVNYESPHRNLVATGHSPGHVCVCLRVRVRVTLSTNRTLNVMVRRFHKKSVDKRGSVKEIFSDDFK